MPRILKGIFYVKKITLKNDITPKPILPRPEGERFRLFGPFRIDMPKGLPYTPPVNCGENKPTILLGRRQLMMELDELGFDPWFTAQVGHLGQEGRSIARISAKKQMKD